MTGFCAFLLMGCNGHGPARAEQRFPNVLILLADDLGYADLSCYDGIARTPNLDRLAANGARLTNFYAGSSNCSPSRVALMTGVVPARMGMYSYRPPNHPMHLPDEAVTVAEILKEAGYQTAHFGKWHLGCLPQDSAFNHPQPVDQGFDYSLGTENNAHPSHLNPDNFVRNGKPVGRVQGYSCQIVVDEAISWLQSEHEEGQPFFMYVAFHEPHAKVASPPELVEKYSAYPAKEAEYHANIENMDLASGRLLDYLEDKKLTENTLIIFISDNGSYRLPSNRPLRAVKSYVYEGGIRVPGIFSWPGHIKPGTTIDEPAGFVDLMPTICEMVEAPLPTYRSMDGISILHLLEGGRLVREKPLYWFFYRTTPEIAMRVGDHVILGKDKDSTFHSHRFSEQDMQHIKTLDLDSFEVYDLQADLAQQHDIAASFLSENPTGVQKIRQLLEEIQKDGPLIERLPPAQGKMKLKSEWVKY